MIAQWKAFLSDVGAVVQDGQVQHFGDPQEERRATATGNVVADLSDHSLIRADGEDVTTFLQGQLSNDIRLLDESHSQLSAYCNPKGRTLTIFRLFIRDNAYMLQLPVSLQNTVLDRLNMYVLRSKVSMRPVDNELPCIGLAGPDAEAILRTQTGLAPKDKDSCVTQNELTVMRIADPRPRFQIVGPPHAIEALWRQVQKHTVSVGTPAWAWLDVMAGIPNIYPETSEAFVPQMLNLELLGAVNFKKGCYSGQEIIARMHHLGKLKQRMYRARAFADETPKPGDAIYAPDLPDQATGTVIDARPSPQDGHDLLAVIHISSVAVGTLHLYSQQGPRLAIKDLPYPLVATA